MNETFRNSGLWWHGEGVSSQVTPDIMTLQHKGVPAVVVRWPDQQRWQIYSYGSTIQTQDGPSIRVDKQGFVDNFDSWMPSIKPSLTT